jgi:hypothetical protein
LTQVLEHVNRIYADKQKFQNAMFRGSQLGIHECRAFSFSPYTSIKVFVGGYVCAWV